ncbi:MAG: ferritin-like domain-containing protein [Marmoricola sp.]
MRPRTRALDRTGTDSLQVALAGEHAAVYVFGVLAAQTSQTVLPKLWSDLDAAYLWHRAARDELVRRITEARQTPVAAAAAYRLPNAVDNVDLVTRAALVTEQRVTDTYGTLVAETAGGLRRWAIRSLDESAVRQLRFRGRPEIFPGTGGLGNQDR